MLDAKKLQEMLQIATYVVAFTAPVLSFHKNELIIISDCNATVVGRIGVN